MTQTTRIFSATAIPLLLMLFSLCPAPLLAQGDQGKFTVNGRLKIDGSDLSDARVVVYKNGAKEKTITVNLNRFSLDLELNSNYVLSFEKDGFVAKKLQFDTKLPANTEARQYAPFEFAVSLFKQYDDMNLVVFNQPVGKIRYEPGMDDFDYDTDYTKSIQSQLQQAVEEVEEKQKEEEKQAIAEAKQQAADAKAQAKAEADEKKLAEANANAAAEAQRLAEANAKAEEERKMSAAKAEQIRLAEEERKAQLAQANEARKAEDSRKAEELRKAQEAKATLPAPPPAPKPAPRPPPAPVVAKAVAAPRPPVSTSIAPGNEHAEQRRSAAPAMAEEASRMAKALPAAGSDAAKHPDRIAPDVVRNEELIIEPTKVMTVIRLEQGAAVAEYRKVIHKWGGTFYFKNGETCSQQLYEKEALIGREQDDDRMVEMPVRSR